MDRRHALKALAGLALCPICIPSAFAAEGPHWSYTGKSGPAGWGHLQAANTACSVGMQQSPLDIGATIKADPAIDPNGMLPAERSYYDYAGSLTTPPCSETVAWMLLTDPIEVAEADVAAFAKLYPMNARPAQKPNRRFVLRSG